MRPPRLILILGILLFVLGNVIQNILLTESNTMSDSPIVSILNQVPALVSFLLIVFILPLIEELGFRAWQLHPKIFSFLSVIIVVVYFYAYTSHPLSVILAVPLLYLFMKKDKKSIRVGTIMLISLLFALLHLKNFSNVYSQLVGVTTLFGFSLILNYLTWRFSIVWAFLLHMLNNGVAIFVNKQEHKIQTNEFTIKMVQQMLYFDDQYINDTEKGIFQYSGDLLGFINRWFNIGENLDIIYLDKTANNPQFNIKIQYTNVGQRHKILDTILCTFNSNIEHIQVTPYVLGFPKDTDTISIVGNENDKTFFDNLVSFKNSLSHKGLYLVKEPRDIHRYVQINFSMLYPKTTKDEIIQQFKKCNYRLDIDPNHKMTIKKLVNR